MKTVTTYALCVLLSLCSAGIQAQEASSPINEPDYNKPKLFADLPQRMPLNVQAFEPLLSLPVGKVVALPLQSATTYQGTVVYKSETPDNSVQSITIKSSNRLGSTFTFTRLRGEDGSISYKRRIISHKHGDAYELVSENGQYVLLKKNLYDLFNE